MISLPGWSCLPRFGTRSMPTTKPRELHEHIIGANERLEAQGLEIQELRDLFRGQQQEMDKLWKRVHDQDDLKKNALREALEAEAREFITSDFPRLHSEATKSFVDAVSHVQSEFRTFAESVEKSLCVWRQADLGHIRTLRDDVDELQARMSMLPASAQDDPNSLAAPPPLAASVTVSQDVPPWPTVSASSSLSSRSQSSASEVSVAESVAGGQGNQVAALSQCIMQMTTEQTELRQRIAVLDFECKRRHEGLATKFQLHVDDAVKSFQKDLADLVAQSSTVQAGPQAGHPGLSVPDKPAARTEVNADDRKASKDSVQSSGGKPSVGAEALPSAGTALSGGLGTQQKAAFMTGQKKAMTRPRPSSSFAEASVRKVQTTTTTQATHSTAVATPHNERKQRPVQGQAMGSISCAVRSGMRAPAPALRAGR